MNNRDMPFVPNPALGGLLGLGALAAAANSLVDGLVLGAGAALSMLLLGALIPPLRRELPERFRAPASIALSMALAILYGLFIEAYFPISAEALWIYIPLLAVNCLSLHCIHVSASQGGRRSGSAGNFAAITKSAAGYFIVALLLGAFREFAGLGTLTLPAFGAEGHRLVFTEEAPLRILVSPAGGFLVLGFMTALYRGTLRARGRRIP